MNIIELIDLIHELEKNPNTNAELIIKYRSMLDEWEQGLLKGAEEIGKTV